MHVTSYIHVYMYSMYIPDVRSFYPVYFSVNHNLTLYSSIWAVMYAQKDKQSAHRKPFHVRYYSNKKLDVRKSQCMVPYSGYFSGDKIFVRSEFLPSSWKTFRGHSILNHTPVHCGTVSWVKISWFTSQPRKPRKFYPPKNTHCTVSSWLTLCVGMALTCM